MNTLNALPVGSHPGLAYLGLGMALLLNGCSLSRFEKQISSGHGDMAQRAEQAQVQAALNTSAAIPPIPRHTKKLNRAYLLRQIFSCQCNEGVVRLVASFL